MEVCNSHLPRSHMLNPTLRTPLDALHKLEREMHRAYHHENYVHKADHFFNFCVTSNSLRDAILKHQHITDDAVKQLKYKEWNAHPLIKAAAEIANTVKHFELRKQAKTKALIPSRSTLIEVRILGSGEIRNVPIEMPDYKVVLSDETEISLFEFTRGVIDFWRSHLETLGISYSPQNERIFFGDAEFKL